MSDNEENGVCRRSVLEAITYKYIDAMIQSTEHLHIFMPRKGPAKLSESGDVILPRNVDLTNYKIDKAGNLEQLLELCANVKELILHNNYLQDWSEVLMILKGMPKLTFLNLTANPLKEMIVTPTEDSIFPNITHLVLNKTQVPWNTIESLLQCFPNLVELHLSLNNYTDVTLSEQLTYPSLQKLFFNNNAVTSWSGICKLGHLFPNLEDLMMCGCELCTIGPDGFEAFSKLKRWSLSQTTLNGWKDIDMIRNFPALYDVRLQDIAFLQDYPSKDRRQLIVARTPNIKYLNGSCVDNLEREDAERAFIRKFLDAEEKPERYYELESIHGKLEPLVSVDLTPKKYFHATILFKDKTKRMKVYTNQTVSQLKMQLAQFVGSPPSKWRLFYLDKELNMGLEELKYPQKMIYTLNINDGDEFHIEMKNES